MLRRSVVLLLVGLLLVGGCKKKDEEGQATPSGGGAGGGAAATETTTTNAGSGGKAVDWAKVDRVPFATLQTVLPESLPTGLKRTDLAGSTHPDGENTYTEASATYEGPNEAYLRVTISDSPLDAKNLLSSKTSSFKGHPLVSEDEGSGQSALKFVVGDRFVVNANAQVLKVAEVKAAFEKVDLSKLASWKDEGLKK